MESLHHPQEYILAPLKASLWDATMNIKNPKNNTYYGDINSPQMSKNLKYFLLYYHQANYELICPQPHLRLKHCLCHPFYSLMNHNNNILRDHRFCRLWNHNTENRPDLYSSCSGMNMLMLLYLHNLLCRLPFHHLNDFLLLSLNLYTLPSLRYYPNSRQCHRQNDNCLL